MIFNTGGRRYLTRHAYPIKKWSQTSGREGTLTPSFDPALTLRFDQCEAATPSRSHTNGMEFYTYLYAAEKIFLTPKFWQEIRLRDDRAEYKDNFLLWVEWVGTGFSSRQKSETSSLWTFRGCGNRIRSRKLIIWEICDMLYVKTFFAAFQFSEKSPFLHLAKRQTCFSQHMLLRFPIIINFPRRLCT